MNSILFGFLASLMISSGYGLSCLPCEEHTCSPPLDCIGGTTSDVCGCCHVCAKVLGETCGGPWGISGTCDEGLACVKDPTLSSIDEFNADGTCGCESPSEYFECGSSCPPTCEERSPVCITVCKRGCGCPVGMVQRSSEDTRCILPEDCGNTECESPRVFDACNGECHKTCDDRSPACPEICTGGCVCPDGMVQISAENTTCVHEFECPPPECDEPRIFDMCGSSCPATCDDPTPICTFGCNVGCFCPEGMVQRSLVDTTCVPLEECPSPGECEEPKVFSMCGSSCPATCDDPTPICTSDCSVGCFCPEGMVQRSLADTTCVPLEECPLTTECEYPMVYSACGGRCHATCDNPTPICTAACFGGCVCQDGMVRRSLEDRTCIPLDECRPTTTCPHPKVLEECARDCQPTCDVPFPSICTKICLVNHCVCPTGYILRSSTNDTCIEESECEARTCEMQDCPVLTSSTCNDDAAKSWMCELENWSCSSYKWKYEMESWMFESGCSYLRENPWEHLFGCSSQIIECKNSEAMTYVTDAFGCTFTKCSDGKYKALKDLLVLWQHLAGNHLRRMEIYQSASDYCSLPDTKLCL